MNQQRNITTLHDQIKREVATKCALPENEISMLVLIALCLSTGVMILSLYGYLTGYIIPLLILPISLVILLGNILIKKLSRARRNNQLDAWFYCVVGGYTCMVINFVVWRALDLTTQNTFNWFESVICSNCNHTTNSTSLLDETQLISPPFMIEIILLLGSGLSLGFPMIAYPLFIDKKYRITDTD